MNIRLALLGALVAFSLSSVRADFKFDTNVTLNLPRRNSQGVLLGYHPRIESLSSCVSNSPALSYVSKYCGDFFHGRTIEERYGRYRKGENSFLAQIAGIFTPYETRGERKNPADTIEHFFTTSRSFREVIRKDTRDTSWSKECRALLQQEFETLELLLDWTSNLAKKNSPKGLYFRKILANKGVNHPEFLVRDLHTIQTAVLRWYDSDPFGTLSALFEIEKK